MIEKGQILNSFSKFNFEVKILSALLVLILNVLLCAPLGYANSGSVKVNIRVPKNAPKVELLNKKFVLVENSTLPEHFDAIRGNWRKVLAAHKQDVFDVKNIPLPRQHKLQWSNLTKLLSTKNELDTLRYINGFFNSIPSQKDDYSYNKKEYWATPHEFLSKGAGDCEDYATAKYFALQYFSWASDKLWLVFLRDNIRPSLHVVLLARLGSKGFILDNLSKPVQLLIPEAQYAKQVKVIGILNKQGMWLPLSSKSK